MFAIWGVACCQISGFPGDLIGKFVRVGICCEGLHRLDIVCCACRSGGFRRCPRGCAVRGVGCLPSGILPLPVGGDGDCRSRSGEEDDDGRHDCNQSSCELAVAGLARRPAVFGTACPMRRVLRGCVVCRGCVCRAFRTPDILACRRWVTGRVGMIKLVAG